MTNDTRATDEFSVDKLVADIQLLTCASYALVARIISISSVERRKARVEGVHLLTDINH